jgi:hypothetical protein
MQHHPQDLHLNRNIHRKKKIENFTFIVPHCGHFSKDDYLLSVEIKEMDRVTEQKIINWVNIDA